MLRFASRTLAGVCLVAHVLVASGALVAAPPFKSHWFLGRANYHIEQSKTKVKWQPRHPQVLLTQFDAQRVSEPGDSVTLSFGWMSEGADECPAKMYSHGKFCQSEWPCAHRSVSCLAGTGDFRIGLFDSKTGKTDRIRHDNFARGERYGEMIKNLEKAPFSKYRGYHYRIYPHVSSKAQKYADEKTGSHIPCGFYIKTAKGLFSSRRVTPEGNGCFELPVGEYATLSLGIKRLSKTEVRLTMEMNKHSFSVEHSWKEDEMDEFNPNWIDTVAIMYPNGRRYENIEITEPFINDGKQVHHEPPPPVAHATPQAAPAAVQAAAANTTSERPEKVEVITEELEKHIDLVEDSKAEREERLAEARHRLANHTSKIDIVKEDKSKRAEEAAIAALDEVQPESEQTLEAQSAQNAAGESDVSAAAAARAREDDGDDDAASSVQGGAAERELAPVRPKVPKKQAHSKKEFAALKQTLKVKLHKAEKAGKKG